MKPLIIAGLLGLALVAGCANSGPGTATPTSAPPTTFKSVFMTPPPTTSPYSPAEQAFLRAYVTNDPANALAGGRAICMGVRTGMFREDIVEMIANNDNKIGYTDANNVFNAATTHLCPDAQVKTKPTGPLTTFTEGDFEVGAEIAAGKYKATGGTNCYWKRYRLGDTSDIIDNHLANGPTTVIIKTGEMFTTKNCGTWNKVG